MSPRIAVVASDDEVPVDLLAPRLPSFVSHHGRDGLPEFGSFDGLVVLGGRMSVEATDEAPWLPDLGQLMVRCGAAGVPVLAICLGAQLLAVASGGRVDVSAWAGPERGVVPITLRPGVEQDPTFGRVHSALGEEFVAPSMHSDAVSELPPDAVWLASSARYPFHAFRVGSALGVQFHPEAGSQTMCRWAAGHGLTTHEVAAQMQRHAESLGRLADLITEGFLAEVAAAGRDQA
ncbi:MAG: type 1 glutamine amidotransferase [Propionicimonas sp.]